jgi:hypothetical protein
VLVGLLGAAVFIRRRAGSPIGLRGLAMEPLVLLFCALVCGVDFYLCGKTWTAPDDLPLFWLYRAFLGLLLGVLVLGFVAWALGLKRQ